MNRSVLTLGTFDGVHRGHQALLRQVVRRARTLKARSVVLAFGLPPRHAGEPRREPFLLSTLDEKLSLLRQQGIQTVDVLRFDRRTASTPAERFFRNTIVGRFGAREMIVGPRVAFGKGRAGRLPLLRRLGGALGVRIRVIGPVRGASADVSSRRIRRLLRAGHVDEAKALLGYPYSAEGPVVHGDRRGRRLGFPTANINVPREKILPRGVFWVKVLPGKRPVPTTAKALRRAADGLCNVGTRPTFDPRAHDLHCEVYIFSGGRRGLYGRRLRVVFMRKIRSERRFASGAALARQITRDLSLGQGWARRFSLQNRPVSI